MGLASWDENISISIPPSSVKGVELSKAMGSST